jgi:hypothetical protein
MMQANRGLFMGFSRCLQPVLQVFEMLKRLLATPEPTSPIQQLLLFVANCRSAPVCVGYQVDDKKSGILCKKYAIYLQGPTVKSRVCNHYATWRGSCGEERSTPTIEAPE